MKKKWCVLLLSFALLILSSCADVDVSYQLTDDNTINIDYYLEISPADQDISQYVEKLNTYWKSMNFETDIFEINGQYNLHGQKTISYDSMQKAVGEFSAVLTDENSLFYDVTFVYTPSYQQDEFSFEASISLKGIIRQNDKYEIPLSDVHSLLTSAQNGAYTLSIILPGKVTETNADNINGQMCTWSLKYGQITKIKVKTTRTNKENIAHYTRLQDTYKKDGQLLTVCCIAGGALITIIFAALIIRRIVRKGYKKSA
ncbi:MAG: LppM family (lipo)protein [Christensenellales bacterium]|jgi:hypothetical protein